MKKRILDHSVVLLAFKCSGEDGIKKLVAYLKKPSGHPDEAFWFCLFNVVCDNALGMPRAFLASAMTGILDGLAVDLGWWDTIGIRAKTALVFQHMCKEECAKQQLWVIYDVLCLYPKNEEKAREFSRALRLPLLYPKSGTTRCARY